MEFDTKHGMNKGDLKKRVCSNCGFELKEGQLFCPQCGTKVDPLKSTEVGVSNNSIQVKDKNKGLYGLKIIIPIILITIIAVVFIFSGGIKIDVGKNKKPVELTPENIKQYLGFEITYDDITKSSLVGIPYYETNAFVKMYPIRSGSFSNVNIQIEVGPIAPWYVLTSEAAYNSSDKNIMFIKALLPASGYYTKNVRIAQLLFGDIPKAPPDIRIISVTGTFTED